MTAVGWAGTNHGWHSLLKGGRGAGEAKAQTKTLKRLD